ncbi:hypothetical protein [Lacipirellula sp.]|uniref:hypothetical protein n=1 Tax=Lacipirellula sp. TaxID=2691419 RepID=UPI003D0C0847
MKIDTVPGWVIRDEDGNLIGLKCPISYAPFFGETCERDQFNHSLQIMERQGLERMDLAERRRLYNQGIGR